MVGHSREPVLVTHLLFDAQGGIKEASLLVHAVGVGDYAESDLGQQHTRVDEIDLLQVHYDGGS